MNVDHVLSFGGVKIQGLKIKIAESMEIFPENQKATNQTVTIHGILDQTERVSLEVFTESVLNFIGNSVVVGHHVGFDL